MEIKGKIIKVLDPRSGISKSKGTPWMSQEYVLETQESRPRNVVFEVFGEDKIKSMNITVGEDLVVSFDIDAREFQGRWYNQIRAWKVERVSGSILTPLAPVTSGDSNSSGVSVPMDPLPFDTNSNPLDILPF